jgi:excisionase family DNA binding protein
MAEYEPYLTPDEACTYLKCGRSRLSTFVKEGLPYTPINKRDRRFKASDLDAFMAQRQVRHADTPPESAVPAPRTPPRARRTSHAKILALPKR